MIKKAAYIWLLLILCKKHGRGCHSFCGKYQRMVTAAPRYPGRSLQPGGARTSPAKHSLILCHCLRVRSVPAHLLGPHRSDGTTRWTCLMTTGSRFPQVKQLKLKHELKLS